MNSACKKNLVKIFKIVLISFVILLALLAGGVSWLYSGELTPLKTKIFSSLPLPMATVNGRMVTMKTFLLRERQAEKMPLKIHRI